MAKIFAIEILPKKVVIHHHPNTSPRYLQGQATRKLLDYVEEHQIRAMAFDGLISRKLVDEGVLRSEY